MGRHQRHSTHENSRAAWRSLNLVGRVLEVYEGLRVHGPMTDRELASRMGKPVSYVQPRITELLDAGVLKEIASVRCAVTGRTVRRVHLAQPHLWCTEPAPVGATA